MNNKDQLRKMILDRLKNRPRSLKVMEQESNLNYRTLHKFLIEGEDVSFPSHLRLEKYLIILEQEEHAAAKENTQTVPEL